MKISMNWINDYVDLSGIDIKELVHKFTMSTAEIEGYEEKGKNIKNVIAGKIVSCETIPESKKLHKLMVDTGEEIVQCMCGAPNAVAGITVPFAKVGGSIEGLPEVGKAKLAGYESNGVCCSAKEIGISDDHSGLMILPESIKAGTDIREILEMDDIILEIDNKSLTNRPDLWGHYGIAREFAAITGRNLKFMPMTELNKYHTLPQIPVEIQDDRCSRYACMSFNNITRKESPYQMQIRLFYCGMRAISFLVDLTNYIMLDIGQPMHAFERDGIEKIVVRGSRGEKFVTLDDVERDIDKDMLFICNNDEPIALAGVMGGRDSEVTEKTKSIILESANFDAATIRKTALKLGMRTEASARYEKTLDSEYTIEALKRFVYLLTEYDDGAVVESSVTDNIRKEQPQIKIDIEKSYIDKNIGEELPMEQIVDILTSLKFKVEVNKEKLTIEVPSFRASKDVTIKADIIEEIARIYGFDNIKPEPTKVALKALVVNEERECEYKTKETLAYEFGLNEVHSYLWYDNKVNQEIGIGALTGIKVLLPSAPEFADIREYMTPIMLKFANENRKNFDEFGIFEIGSVASKVKDDVSEHKNLSVLIASKKKSENDLFYELKGMINKLLKITKNIELSYEKCESNLKWIHPVKAAKIMYDGKELGVLSVIHPIIKNNIDKKLNIAFAEFNMFEIYKIDKKDVKFTEPSKYPEINYDLSLLVDDNKAYADIENDIKSYKNDIMLSTKFVDLYCGKGLPEGKKSITFNFVWGSFDHTLTNEEVDKGKEDLLNYLKEKGYESRY